MRVLYFRRHDGNLSPINAILGAGVVLPANIDPKLNVDIFDEFGEERGRRVLDMYFYTVNNWRECVSAYTSQQETPMRQKVLTRLSEILEWEEKIKETLAHAPEDYVPPTCIFLTESSVSRTNMSRFKRGQFIYCYFDRNVQLKFFFLNVKFCKQVRKREHQNERKPLAKRKPANFRIQQMKRALMQPKLQFNQQPDNHQNETTTGPSI